MTYGTNVISFSIT